jgi:KDO2-lipid IV(A) lauroyltransferase
MALFARQTQVPIFPSLVTRVGWSGHTMRVFDPVWPDQSLDKRDDWQRMTQTVFTVIEQQIRNQPEQWFWFNKRWILDPM